MPSATSEMTEYKKPKPGPVQSKLSHVKVGVWTLRSTEFVEIEAPENTESLFSGVAGESVIGEDNREKVNKKDFMPGGKYRSIVKLFLRFAGQDKNAPWAMGTGWLVNDDTIVTAGHCAYDWSHNLGRLTHVKAYIGYYGKESVKDSKNYAVQFRTGKRVAIPQGWLASDNNPHRDVAFIQVNRPYTGITAIKYQATPLTGTKMVLGVVGYPGDLMNPKSKEKGAHMYEMYSPTTYNILKTKNKMLQYKVDTYGGNSGSPVIFQGKNVSIGVHVLGGYPNSASIISGAHGNSFGPHITALKGKAKELQESGEATVNGKEAGWLSWVTVPASESVASGEADQPDESFETGAESLEEANDESEVTLPVELLDQESGLEENFFKFMRNAFRVPGPLGMIASIGMKIVGNLLRKKKEAAFDEAYSFEGVAERALLGEAALGAVVKLGAAKCKKLGIFKRMQPTIRRLQPYCRRAAPLIMPLVMEPAWRMTLPKPQKREGSHESAEHIPSSAGTNALGLGPRLPANAEAFIRNLTENLTSEDVEAFTGTETSIGEVVSKALRLTGPILGSVAESGLSRLLEEGADTEASVDADPKAEINDPESSAYTYDAMSQRAIAGEAALEALLGLPEETLQQEGIGKKIRDGIRKWGRRIPGPAGWLFRGGSALARAAAAVAAARKRSRKRELEAEADHPDEAAMNGETGDVEAGGMEAVEITENEFLETLENEFAA